MFRRRWRSHPRSRTKPESFVGSFGQFHQRNSFPHISVSPSTRQSVDPTSRLRACVAIHLFTLSIAFSEIQLEY